MAHPSTCACRGTGFVCEAHPENVAHHSCEAAAMPCAHVDEDVVGRAYGAPYGVATAGVLASERLDMQRCARFHPVVGMDYSSLCLR